MSADDLSFNFSVIRRVDGRVVYTNMGPDAGSSLWYYAGKYGMNYAVVKMDHTEYDAMIRQNESGGIGFDNEIYDISIHRGTSLDAAEVISNLIADKVEMDGKGIVTIYMPHLQLYRMLIDLDTTIIGADTEEPKTELELLNILSDYQIGADVLYHEMRSDDKIWDWEYDPGLAPGRYIPGMYSNKTKFIDIIDRISLKNKWEWFIDTATGNIQTGFPLAMWMPENSYGMINIIEKQDNRTESMRPDLHTWVLKTTTNGYFVGPRVPGIIPVGVFVVSDMDIAEGSNPSLVSELFILHVSRGAVVSKLVLSNGGAHGDPEFYFNNICSKTSYYAQRRLRQVEAAKREVNNVVIRESKLYKSDDGASLTTNIMLESSNIHEYKPNYNTTPEEDFKRLGGAIKNITRTSPFSRGTTAGMQFPDPPNTTEPESSTAHALVLKSDDAKMYIGPEVLKEAPTKNADDFLFTFSDGSILHFDAANSRWRLSAKSTVEIAAEEQDPSSVPGNVGNASVVVTSDGKVKIAGGGKTLSHGTHTHGMSSHLHPTTTPGSPTGPPTAPLTATEQTSDNTINTEAD